MALGLIFVYNQTQPVRLPAETRFPEGVKKVFVRVVGVDRVLSPVRNAWDSFFYPKSVLKVSLHNRATTNPFPGFTVGVH
jgi:antitoxin VapB